MATRNVTYQFEWGFATYDRRTEADAIAQIEDEKEYIDKFDVSVAEREIIDQNGATIEVIDGECVVTRPEEVIA